MEENRMPLAKLDPAFKYDKLPFSSEGCRQSDTTPAERAMRWQKYPGDALTGWMGYLRDSSDGGMIFLRCLSISYSSRSSSVQMSITGSPSGSGVIPASRNKVRVARWRTWAEVSDPDISCKIG